MEINTGISSTDRTEVVKSLEHLLADTYSLYLMTQNFHWNVTGAMAQTLHLMFEAHYQELAQAIDVIAERIRALGFPTPATFEKFLELTSIRQAAESQESNQMIRKLIEGHEQIARFARGAMLSVHRAHDEVSADLLTQRMDIHEKNAWQLRALLKP